MIQSKPRYILYVFSFYFCRKHKRVNVFCNCNRDIFFEKQYPKKVKFADKNVAFLDLDTEVWS